MLLKDSKLILWENVQTLMTKRYGKKNLGKFATDCGIGAASMTRIKAAKTSVGVDTIEAIAREFKLQPWQILVDGLVADTPPALAGEGLATGEGEKNQSDRQAAGKIPGYSVEALLLAWLLDQVKDKLDKKKADIQASAIILDYINRPNVPPKILLDIIQPLSQPKRKLEAN